MSTICHDFYNSVLSQHTVAWTKSEGCRFSTFIVFNQLYVPFICSYFKVNRNATKIQHVKWLGSKTKLCVECTKCHCHCPLKHQNL